MASRTADSTIRGFLYQFNKTLLSIVQAEDDETIVVEGLIEDLDVVSRDGSMDAIQCKYHESQVKFTDSLIYKPLLQMAETFSNNSDLQINFTIFLHVPTEKFNVRDISQETLSAALSTKDKSLIKIVGRIDNGFDQSKFLESVKIEFGPSIDDLELEVKEVLKDLKLSGADIDSILYPNAISRIAKISSLKADDDRKITRKELFKYLSNVTTAAISKWTLALKNRKEILTSTRKQLAAALSQNNRERYFYFTQTDIDDFDDNIIVFICNFLSKYHSKVAHLKTPVIAIDGDDETVKNLKYRLYKKGVGANIGLIGDHFEVEEFFRDPIQKIVKSKIKEREFDLRLLALNSQPDAINYRKCDDFYLICNSVPDYIDLSDTNFYQIGTENFKELEFIINLRDSHE